MSINNNIISFSGGKDSTAMLHLMLEKGEDIKAVIYCDMGDWEFPELTEHIALVEKNTGINIVKVQLPFSLTHRAFHYEYKSIHGINGIKKGVGWPSKSRRWCTSVKNATINIAQEKIGGGVMCVGLAVDETKRTKSKYKRYPLIEYGYTEKMCLDY